VQKGAGKISEMCVRARASHIKNLCAIFVRMHTKIVDPFQRIFDSNILSKDLLTNRKNTSLN
jgi:hypothetical protein